MKKIPKTIHLYWGGDRLPFMRYLTFYSLRKYNPSWQIKLYCPTKLTPGFRLTGKNYMDRLKKLGVDIIKCDLEKWGISNKIVEIVKSDFLRWHLLGTEGGIWCDSDILFFRPLSDLECDSEADTFVCFHGRTWSIGFLMSSPNNALYKHVHKVSFRGFGPEGKPVIPNLQVIGSYLLRRQYKNVRGVLKRFPKLKIQNISMSAVYPRDSVHATEIYGTKDYLQENTIGIHWYGGFPKSKKFLNQVEENNYFKYDNILCKTIGRVLKG